MGRRGPQPKPQTIRMLEGNPGFKPGGAELLGSDGKMPRCPEHIHGNDRRRWKRTAKRLVDSGVVGSLDAMAVEMLVNAYHDYVEARQTDDTNLHETTRKALLTVLKEFGLTPASRSRVQTTQQQKPQADPAAKYFA